ncbi:dienelactone hydrolase family protein [Rhodococcus koreensis]
MTEGRSEQNVTFPSGSGDAHGYLQLPASGSGKGVIVIQEWWGLTTHVADLTRRLAAEGFVALAPDLYGGRTTHDAAEAATLRQSLPVEQAVDALKGAVDFLVSHPAVSSDSLGAIGFCMGGGFVFELAAQCPDKISAAVPFYGIPRSNNSLLQINAAVQGHFGEKDASLPLEAVDEVFRMLGKRERAVAERFIYPAGHAFLNDENLIGTYDRESADLAWQRAVSFLLSNIS